jgi:hypothetical protein
VQSDGAAGEAVAELLHTLYRTKGHYRAKFQLNLAKLTLQGFWLKEYTKLYAIKDMFEFSYE